MRQGSEKEGVGGGVGGGGVGKRLRKVFEWRMIEGGRKGE